MCVEAGGIKGGEAMYYKRKRKEHRFGKEDREVNESDLKGGKQGNNTNKWKKYT